MGPSRDAIVTIIWLAANASLIGVGWRIGRILFPGDGPAQLVMHVIVSSFGCICAVSLALGAVGCLDPILLVSLVSTIVTVAYCERRNLRAAPPWLGAEPIGIRLASTEPAWVYVLWAFALTNWLVLLWPKIMSFPSNWDTMMYHLPLIDQWIMTGSLFSTDCAHWYSPGNTELLGYWIVGLFSGDFLVPLMNLPSAVLMACASVEMGENLGLSRSSRHLCALAITSHVALRKQLGDVETDLAACGLFLAGVAYALRYAKYRNRADIGFAAISLGLLSGVKYYALGYAVAAGTFLLLLVFLKYGARCCARPTIVLSLAVILLGGVWYVRNMWIGGSPFFPAGYSPSGGIMATLCPGIRGSSFMSNRSPEIPRLAVRAAWKMGGPCHAAALVLSPLTVAWLVVSGFWLARGRGPGRQAGLERVAFGLLTLASGLVLLSTPFTVEDVPGTLNQLRMSYCPFRYGLCFLSLAIIGLVMALEDISRGAGTSETVGYDLALLVLRRPSRAFQEGFRALPARLPAFCLFLLLAVATGSQLTVSRDLDRWLLATNLLAAGAVVWSSWRARPRIGIGLAVVALLVGAGGMSAVVTSLSRDWHLSFAERYSSFLDDDSIRFLERNYAEARICLFDYLPYPFYGSRRQFRVFNPLLAPSQGEMIRQYVDTRRVDLVAVRASGRPPIPGWNRFEDAQRWFEAGPEGFEPVFAGNEVILYEVVAPGVHRGSSPGGRDQ